MDKKRFFYVAIYAIGMAYLEASIVVYLRKLYGISDLMISVPAFDPMVSIIELGRELATLILGFGIFGIIYGLSFSSDFLNHCLIGICSFLFHYHGGGL